jgi:hypothetical protein
MLQDSPLAELAVSLLKLGSVFCISELAPEDGFCVLYWARILRVS